MESGDCGLPKLSARAPRPAKSPGSGCMAGALLELVRREWRGEGYFFSRAALRRVGELRSMTACPFRSPRRGTLGDWKCGGHARGSLSGEARYSNLN